MNSVLAMESKQERYAGVIGLGLLVAALAMLFGFVQRPEFAFSTPSATVAGVQAIDPALDPQGHAKQARMNQLNTRFEQAVAMLHAKQYEFAVTALHRVIELSPNMPEAHVNMGFALLGLNKYKAAGDFFANAIRLNAYQGNAYWGLAVALEKLGDKEAALGAMRSYIHLAPPDDPYVKKARSALWEWGEELKRGPLPKAEAQWLAEQGQRWEDRNSLNADFPSATQPNHDLIAPSPSTIR